MTPSNSPEDLTCPICKKPTRPLSPENVVQRKTPGDWENESTMALLDWETAGVQMRLCSRCFLGIIFPRFDAAALYGERGRRVRKETWEKYFPGSRYGEKSAVFSGKEVFGGVSRELSRFSAIMSAVSRRFPSRRENREEIRILDWGGGDGYIGAVLARLVSAVSGVPARGFIYDYTEWSNPEAGLYGLAELETMKPFDIVLLSHVLEHTHDPAGTIQKAASFLDAGGLVVCEVPDERIGIFRAYAGRRFTLHYHVLRFTRRSLFMALQAAGLREIECFYRPRSSYRGAVLGSIVGVGSFSVPGESSQPPSLLGEKGRLFGLGIASAIKNRFKRRA